MGIGILLVRIANRDNGSHGLISSSPCGFAVSHAVLGYITPLTLVAYLVLFHVIIPPNRFRSKTFFLIAVLCGHCLGFAVSLVILNGIFGLILFQAGCASIDNFSLVLIVCLGLFIKFIAFCVKTVLQFIPICCTKRDDVSVPCCYRACPCTPNKLMCFTWIVYLLMMTIIVIVMLARVERTARFHTAVAISLHIP